MKKTSDSQNARQPAHNPRVKKSREVQTRRPSLRKALSGKELDDHEFDAALTEFMQGSDRVAAIMGAALVETQLSEVIAHSLIDASDKRSLFDDPGAPFSTFKARIVAAKAMGVVPAQIAEDMNIIRDIRNQFAHGLLSFDFTHPAVSEACLRMADYPPVDEAGRQISPARLKFEAACTEIAVVLMRRSNALIRAQVDGLKRINESATVPDGVTVNALFGAKARRTPD